MKSGLTKKDIEVIQKTLSKFPEVKSAIIFGSRALGNYKKGSDIDLALKGDLTPELISQIQYQMEEETNLPYFFDVVDYGSIEKQALLEHIDQYGKKLI